jgi:hypothetical protein
LLFNPLLFFLNYLLFDSFNSLLLNEILPVLNIKSMENKAWHDNCIIIKQRHERWQMCVMMMGYQAKA